MPTITDIIQSLISLLSLVGVVVLWRKAKWEVKKEEASTAEQYEGIAERTLTRLNKEIESNQALRDDLVKLKKEVEGLRDQVLEYERGINLLIAQLELNHFTPVWKPKKKTDSA